MSDEDKEIKAAYEKAFEPVIGMGGAPAAKVTMTSWEVQQVLEAYAKLIGGGGHLNLAETYAARIVELSKIIRGLPKTR
jgi:hypothetical protein